MTQQEPLAPTRLIARRIKEARQRLDWSAQRLAEEMTAVGIKWDRSIVANLESGRRGTVSVEEMLALAYVLDVAPVDLIVPGHLTAQQFQVAPNVAAPADSVREWIRGEDLLAKEEGGRVGNALISVSGATARIMQFAAWMPNERSKEVMKRLILAAQRETQRQEVRAMLAEEQEGNE